MFKLSYIKYRPEIKPFKVQSTKQLNRFTKAGSQKTRFKSEWPGLLNVEVELSPSTIIDHVCTAAETVYTYSMDIEFKCYMRNTL